MSTVDRINEQTGKHDQPHALSDEAELCRARLRTAATCGYTVSLNVPEVKRLLAMLDAHANDLADMQRAVEQIEEVYYHITGGQLSKWQTDPVHIKQAHDDACNKVEQETLDGVEVAIKGTKAERTAGGGYAINVVDLKEIVARLRGGA